MSYYYGKPLAVEVSSGKVTIEIGIHTLAHASAYSDWANPFDEAREAYRYMKSQQHVGKVVIRIG